MRWETQINVIPIPKAASAAHQLANLDIFDFKLTPNEVDAITALDQTDSRRFDPHEHEEF